MIRYSTDRAEQIRKGLKLDADGFSIRLGLSPRTYPAALRLGFMTKLVVRQICYTFHVPMSDFEPVEISPSRRKQRRTP